MTPHRGRFPRYPDDVDYTTNSPSYYDFLARMEKLIRELAKRIGFYDEELEKRFAEWDQLISEFPEDVKKLLMKWMDDGTFDHLINVVVLGSRARIVVSDEEPEHDNLTFWYQEIDYPTFGTTNIVVSETEPDSDKIWYELEEKTNG